MPQNPIYEYLKNNGQTTLEEGKFLEKYSNKDESVKIYNHLKQIGLTSLDFDKFHNKYLAPSANVVSTAGLNKPTAISKDTGSVYNEKTGPMTSKQNAVINKTSEYDPFKFIVDPANLVDRSEKRITETKTEPDDTKMFENEMTKFNRNLLKVDGQEIFPEQDPSTKSWYYSTGGKRVDLLQNPIKEGTIVKVKPENQWFYSQQYDYKYNDPKSPRNGKNIPVHYLQYSNGKYTPVEKPVSTKPEELAPAFVTATKRNLEKTPKPNVKPEGFAGGDLFKLAKSQGGAAEYQRLINLDPEISKNINKRLGELGYSYAVPASENPTEAKKLMTEAVLSTYKANYDGYDNDIKIISNADQIMSSYKTKQEALNAKMKFLARDVFAKNNMKGEYDEYMSLAKKLKNNSIAVDAMDYFTIVNKTNQGAKLSDEEQIKWNALLAKKFNPNSQGVKDVINSVTKYQELSSKLSPLFTQINESSKKINELFANNNKELDKFKSDYTTASNRLSSNVNKQKDLMYALDIVNNRIFKKQNELDRKQYEFDVAATTKGLTVGQHIESFFGAALKGSMAMTKSVVDATSFLANKAMQGSYGSPYNYFTSEGVDRWYERGIPTVNSKYQAVSQEFKQQAMRTGKQLSSMHGQDIATTLGDMVPTILATVLTEGVASIGTKGAVIAETAATKGVLSRIGLDKATTFAATMATTVPRFYEEGRKMRLTGNALHLYAIGSGAIEGFTESFLSLDELLKAGSASHIGSSIMKDFLAGKISKSNLNNYAFEQSMGFVKNFMKNGTIEEAENIASNVLTPMLNMLVNKVESRKDEKGNIVDVASEEFEITNLDEIITTFGVTLLPSAGRAALPGGTAFDIATAYGARPSMSAMHNLSLKIYQNSPAMMDNILSKMEGAGNTDMVNNLSDLLTNFESKVGQMPDNITDEQKIVMFGIMEKMNQIDESLKSITDPAVSLSYKKMQSDLQKRLDEVIANPEIADKEVEPSVKEAQAAIDESLAKAKDLVDLRFGTVEPAMKESGAASIVTPPEVMVSEKGTMVIRPSAKGGQTYQIGTGVSVTSTPELEKKSAEKRIQIQNPHKPSFSPTQKTEETSGDIVTETQLSQELADSNAKTFFEKPIKQQPRKAKKTVSVSVSDASGNKTTVSMQPQKAQSMLKKRNFDLLNILNCVLK